MRVRPVRLLAFVTSALVAATGLAGAASAAVSPATALNAFSILGEPGNWNLDGGLRDYRGAAVTVSHSYEGGLDFVHEPTSMAASVYPPDGSIWTPGTYPLDSNGTGAVLLIAGEGRGCNQAIGQLVVHEASYDDAGQLTAFAATYEKTCDSTAKIGGELRFNSSIDYVVFGDLPAGAHRPHTVTVRAAEPTTFGTAHIAGGIATSPQAFEITNDQCSGQTLSAGATCTIAVEGWAARIGRNQGQLNLPVAGGSPRIVTLGAEGRETPSGGYVAVKPTRVLDTRSGNGAPKAAIGARRSINVQIAGRGGVSAAAGVSSVVLNVTATGATAGGYLTVWPAGQARPTTSSINFAKGVTRANLVTVPVSSTGAISVFNASGSTHVIADVVGYYRTGVTTLTPYGSYFPSTPWRLDDTRSDGGALPAGYYRNYWFGYGPSTDGHIKAVAVNITTTGGTGAGYLSAWNGDTTAFPSTSSLNYTKGANVANMAVVPVRPEYDPSDGRTWSTFSIANIGANVHVIVDVVGFYDDHTVNGGSRFVPLGSPRRIVDTRSGLGTSTMTTNSTRRILTGQAVSGYNTLALVGNLTGVAPSAGTYLTAWRHGITRPVVSNLNLAARQTAANMAVVGVGNFNDIALYNSTGSVDALFDVAGTMEFYPQRPEPSVAAGGPQRSVPADGVSQPKGGSRGMLRAP